MFNRTFRLLAVAAVALPLAACAPRDTGGTATTTTTTTSAPAATAPAPKSAATGDMSSPMAGGSGMSSPMPGMAMSPDAHGGVTAHTADMPYDAMFLEMMVMHHEQAVTMAEDVLPQAKRPEVKELARAIIASQQEEIEKMQGWRQAWYPDSPAMTDEQMSAMMKMDMQSPAAAAPGDPEQRFLAEMIPHHQEAIRMSREALQQAEHPELRTMAQGIIEEQEKEIAQMQAWLGDWTAER